MAFRGSLLVCSLVLIAGGPVARAQTTSKEPGTPTSAAAAVPSALASTQPSNQPEADPAGRSLLWPRDQGGTNSARPQGDLLPFERGVLFLPYLGAVLPLGSDGYTAGQGFGAMIGVHVTPGFSLNSEINFEFMNPGPLATETQVDYALGALLQGMMGRRLLVLGFKAGAFNLTRSVAQLERVASSETSYSATGFVWGVTMGGFIPVGPAALGCLARLTVRHLSSNCGEDGNGKICHEGEKNGISPALTTFNFSAAALF